MFKKLGVAALFMIFLVQVFAACGSPQKSDKLSVYASVYPVYFLATEIGGDKADVVNMLPTGGDAHGFDPSSMLMDMLKSDILVVCGAGMEDWLSSFVGILQKDSYVMTGDGVFDQPYGHDHSGQHQDTGSGAEDSDLSPEADGEQAPQKDSLPFVICDTSYGAELIEQSASGTHSHGLYDPHIWTSPSIMRIMAANVLAAFKYKDAVNADYYQQNFDTLDSALEQLHDDYMQGLSGYEGRHIVVAHRAFGYLCRDYGINQLAVQGISTEHEPLPADVTSLIQKIQQYNIKVIFADYSANRGFMQVLADEVAQKGHPVQLRTLSSAETLSAQQVADKEDYLSVMRQNLAEIVNSFG